MLTYDEAQFTPPAPVATVEVENPKVIRSRTEVRMLIDSGADISVMPRAIVASAGLVSSEAYEVVSFEGSLSKNATVWADVIFQGKRFKGRYLVFEGDTGILGRDILNHVCLVLNGPNRQWHTQ